MQIDLNRLRIFYHVYQELSVTKAAGTLYVTPSAVSQQLKKLEEELQTSLFTRFHKRLIPTGSANHLFDLAAPLIEGLQTGVEQMGQERNELSGLITFGAPTIFGGSHITRLIADFRKHHDKVTFDMKLGRPSKLANLVERGEIDFAFIDDFPTCDMKDIWSGFHVTPLLEERVALACSRRYDDEVLKNDHSLESLLSASYITKQYGQHRIRKWFRQQFSIEAKKLDNVMNVSNHRSIMTAIRCGLGIGIIAPHLAQRAIKNGKVVIIREKENESTNTISILRLANKPETLKERTFLNHVITAVEKICDDTRKTPIGKRLGLRFTYPKNVAR